MNACVFLPSNENWVLKLFAFKKTKEKSLFRDYDFYLKLPRGKAEKN